MHELMLAGFLKPDLGSMTSTRLAMTFVWPFWGSSKTLSPKPSHTLPVVVKLGPWDLPGFKKTDFKMAFYKGGGGYIGSTGFKV